jgi:hypothetical protein
MALKMGCRGFSAPLPVQVEVYDNKKIVYWNCPRKFIPQSVFTWYDKYTYHQKFAGAKMESYENQSYKFLQACNVYEARKNEFLNESKK